MRYDNGEGVPQDDQQAYAWFSVAAANGHAEAVKNREIIVEQITPTAANGGANIGHALF